ncbi:MAG: right-handed parallel beta-helix repeat-containing protein [Ignavibacteria bacterium]|nr:right-handed parallel beta-helix repeat-containing protein [Ignavibacteria bacterium]
MSITVGDLTAQQNDDAQPINKVLRDGNPPSKRKVENKKSGTNESLKKDRNSSFGTSLEGNDVRPIERILREGTERVTVPMSPSDGKIDPNAQEIVRNVPGDHPTIQAAINAASNGDIISVAPGIYRENITLNKFLSIRGANYGINPNTGVRGAESIIQPGTSDPDPNSPTAVTFFYIEPGGSGSTIDGFTFDGDNNLLVSSVNINGANIDAAEAIGAYDGLSNTTVRNNIIKNLNYAGIDFYNFGNGGASTYDNSVTANLFDNIIPTQFGIAVLIYNNCYTSITNNVMTRVRIGVQTGNFYNSDLGTNHSISNNEIESYRLGIFHNLAYTNATAYTISDNLITTVAGAPNNHGILVSSIDGNVGATITDNDVTDARVGVNFWNCPTTNTITVTGGNFTDCNIGIFPNNYDGYTSDAATSSYAITGVTLTNCDTAIWVRDNNLNSNSATVTLNINNTTNIVTGTGIGLLIEGGDASVIFNGSVPVDFSTTHSKYIRLISNGSGYPTSDINALGVQFGGTAGAGLSDAQLFAVEDKIDHKMDFNTLGFVRVKADNSYITVNSFYLPETFAASIQNGIDITPAADTLSAASGVYREDITLDKQLVIKGANFGINPNTGVRVAETIIQPGTSDPDPNSLTSVIFFYIEPSGSGSTIDGITFDGDNTTLTSSVNINGANIDAVEAIAAYEGLSDVKLTNNIVKNLNYAGIDLYNYYNSGAATTGNLVSENLFDNIIPNSFGIGIVIYNNCYSDITDNVMTRVRIGIQTGNFYNADPGTSHDISNNEVESSRIGIFHNLTYTNASTFNITSNNFTTVTGATNNNGMLFSSIGSAVGAVITDNDVTDARIGCNFWNCTTSNTITVTGGNITDCNVGVFPNNYDGYSSNAGSGTGAITGVTITNCDTSIWIRDNNLNTNNATIALNINNATNVVNGTGIGLLIEGGDAFVNFNGAVPIDFSSTHSKYIRLTTNGSSYPNTNINAQSVRFGGLDGAGMSNVQLFDVEDKIDHKIDFNSLGFVSVKPNNSYVTTNSFYLPDTSVPSIQNAINIAAPASIVNLDSGTFNENVTVSNSISLIGSGTGGTILTPSVSCTGDGLTITASNVNVSNLTLSTYVYGIRTSSSNTSLYSVESILNCQYGINVGNGTSNLSMIKCKFNNNTVGGWRSGTAETATAILMDSSEVKYNGVGVNNGFGIFVAATTPAANVYDGVTIRNSNFSGNLKKGMYFEKLRNALIENVLIDSSGTDATYGFNNGIDLNLKYDSYSNISILNCTITNCGFNGTSVDPNNPAAVTIKARDDAPSYSADPATLQIVPGSCTGTGPVTNITQSTNYIAIQPAIDAANPGDVIEASAGTYNEKVTITKSLTLQGVNRSTVIVDGTGFVAPAKGITINNGITNVTIQNLTVQNFAGSGGNSEGGIYAIGGNNNLTVNNVTIQNNSNGSGFYANGPVNTVLLDSVTVSGHNVGARGIVIWNGLKENITITNCEVFSNNCCGIELQDGTASGVTISNNYVHDNFDNGIGIVGLQGPGENLISGNTLVNNGRFGIEIKNPNGSGLTTGPGRVVVENNNVSRTVPIVDARDIVGIAAFRRGVLPGNVDVPNGTVIQNNTVSGYAQTSTSDGFGIVVEGTNHTVSGNTVTGCDVGIQRQAGHLPYPADGDQSNLADAYFGRGNSPVTCGVTIGSNTLTNTINTRDVGAVAGGIVTNINTSEIFCSIQSAINDAQTLNGHTITVPSGAYNEQVLVNKSVAIKGVGATKPVLDFTGTVSGKPTLFDVSVRDVTIENMKMRVDFTKLSSAIIASGTDIDNIAVKNDSIEAYGSSNTASFGPYGNRNAISINYSGSTNYRIAAGGVDNVLVDSNYVSGVANDGFGVPRFFRSAVSVDEAGGVFSNNTMQTINHDVLVRFGSNGNINITNNNLIGGGVELSDMNAGAGVLTVSGNTFDATFANTSSQGAAVLRLKNNTNFKTTNVTNNTFVNHLWGVSVENYNSLTMDANSFTPLLNSTVFHHVAVNTKSISTNSNAIVQVAIGAVLTNNVFNYSGTNGGTALSFHNHDNDAAAFGTFTIGTSGNENIFNSGFANFIYLDNQTGASNLSTFPPYTTFIGAGASAITTMACWTPNLNIQDNRFDVGSGLQLPSAMNFTQRTALETGLFHKPDNSCLGNLTFFKPVHNLTQNTFFETIQSAINSANANDVIECDQYTYNEKVTIDKSLTLQGVDRTTVVVDGTGFVAPAKGITINNGITNVTIQNLTVQNFAGSGGNSEGGIYAIGGNNNLTVNNVTIQNNSNGSGFYANGPVNTVLLDSVTVSGHNVGARGIVIWNGLKENITITNCEVFNNNCCGIELQDGTASGVTISNNYVHDNFDNGIGIVGLQGPGENLISGNTLVNNGRFGIEIKNPNGSGLTTGPGRVVVENNNVSRTLPIADLRDIVGIAAFRRGVLPGNVDVPNGTVIQNNTVSGYAQTSTSDGFGIVVEGTNHTVSGNTVTGCDVGIQRQAGHLPYPADGDQSNLADAYFGRGNSPVTCGVTIGSNTLTNTINTRDVGAVAGGIVTNINTSEIFCSIQSAINDAQTLGGHTITVPSGTYNEQVLVNKSVTIKGVGATKPVLNFTGTVSGKPTLFDVSVRDVTIQNMRLRVDQTKLSSAIIASGTDIDNIAVKSDSIEAYASSAAGAFGSYGNWNAISINYSGPTNYRIAAGGVDNVSVDSNTVTGVADDGFGQPRYFRAAVSVDEAGGVFSNNTMQSINHDVLVRFGSNGNVNVTNNKLNGGGVEYSDMNAGAGVLTVSGNIFDATFANTSSQGAAVLRLKNNYNFKTTNVTNNTFVNHQWGVSVENYNSLTLDGNTFTPLANSTTFHHVVVNTKSISTNSNAIVQVTTSATLTNNTFNYSGTNGGTALSFHNHDNDAASLGTITVGTSGNENDFNSGIANFVYLDNQTGASNLSTFPPYTTFIGAGAGAITTMACWSTDINIESNMFNVGSGLQLPSAMNFSQRNLLEAALFHKPDNACLGSLTYFLPVHNITQNTYFMTIQSSIAVANSGDVIECSEYVFNEKVTIDKPLTLQGLDKVNTKVDGTGIASPAKGITINNGITNVTIQNLTVQNFAGASGNGDGGIYGIGGNNNLTVNNVIIQNNSNGSGFYANGPVNTVLLDSVTVSGHNVGARGIVIWNGLKENITITNCEVFNNNCCGIELQDGTASGVTISNNYVHDNFDNGIGIVGLQGPGENLISGNTLVNNGRFGIEIKNPNGSGLTTGPGRVVVENNNVSRTVPIVDQRDIAGIAAFRRGVLPGNVDVPNGTVIQNNTVSGYAQLSTSDGFGIVVEGTNHTVSGNTVTGCDVGIQRQAGHLPYPADGDQSNLADAYFGRGNSPITCAITISGNILTNTLNTRDVGASTGSGIVMNINTNEMFCSIQAAIDDAQTLNGHVIDIDSATYTESVVVSKQVTLKGNGGTPNGRPTIVGVAGQAISVTAPNVTIDNVTINFDQGTVNTGIRAATSGTFNNLTVKNSHIYGTGNTGLPVFASFGLQLGSTGGVQYDQVNLDSNEIKHIGTSWIGRGVRTLNCFGDWKNSTVDGYYAFQSGDNQGGILNITGNNTKGTNELNYFGAGAHSFNNNVCKPASAFGGGTDFAMLELKNVSLPASSLNITGNSFEEYVNFGIFSGRANNITIDNNTFIPEPSAVNFRSIRIDTKQRTLPAQSAFVSGAVITNNTFFGSIAPGENGISVELANSDNVSSIGTVVIGTPGNGNIFNTNTKKFISLNNETLSTAGDPIWTSTYVSTKAKVTANVTATDNQYDAGAGVQFPTAMNLNTLFILEDHIQHSIDDGGLGFVTAKAGNTFVTINSFVTPATTAALVQRGINPASSGFTVNVNSGTYTGAINVNKGVKLLGLNSAISPNTGIRNPEAKLTTASGIMMNVTTTEPVDIKGFEVANAGGAFDYSITGAVDANVRLEKNFFNNSIGLYFPNSDTFNVIDNRCTFSSGADEGMALFGDYNGSTGTYSDIHDNVFLNGLMTGFNLSNINGKVYKNTFSNIAYYAILVANLCNLDIYENSFLNISNPDTTVTTWGAGIRFYDDANGAIVSVHNNLFSGNYNGVTVRTAYDFTGVTVSVNDNSISGSTRWNIRNEGTGALPASCNWFGSASNDTISQKLSGTINYTPWLVTGVDNDLGTAGFQPVPGSCTGQPIIAGTLNLKIKLEASTCADTVIVHMRSGTTPFALVSADTAVMDTAGNVVLNFPTVVNGTNYYIAVFHRNSMETWSATTQVFTLGTLTYDFTTGVNKAYGNNMKLVSGTARIYAGDVNQDDVIDGSDVLLIDNDAFNFVFGYTDTDLNCDGGVDGTDQLIADNNTFAVITVSKP